jgi:hypothetical protein
MRFKEQLGRWWLGANRAGLTGGAVAVKAFLATSAAAGAGMQIAPLGLKETVCVFGFGFAVDFFDYLQRNPLPEIEQEITEGTEVLADGQQITPAGVERLKAALPGIEPSGGHDWIEEVLGLLRVAQGQRDAAERQLSKFPPGASVLTPAATNDGRNAPFENPANPARSESGPYPSKE